jgi:quercetin dioxygenase-like cupin family protein
MLGGGVEWGWKPLAPSDGASSAIAAVKTPIGHRHREGAATRRRQKEDGMRRITYTAVFAIVAILLASSMAIAAIVNITLARGTVMDPQKVNIPDLAKFENKQPVDFVHSELTFQPGDATPWHYHPGPTLVTVKEGEITFTMDDCTDRTYRVGESFVEGHPGRAGRAQNTGSTVAKVNAVFITPVGSATTFPVPAVTCP